MPNLIKKVKTKYSVYSTSVDDDARAAGGSTILLRDNILHNSVNLNSYLHAVATDNTTTSCTVYIPPNVINQADLAKNNRSITYIVYYHR